MINKTEMLNQKTIEFEKLIKEKKTLLKNINKESKESLLSVIKNITGESYSDSLDEEKIRDVAYKVLTDEIQSNEETLSKVNERIKRLEEVQKDLNPNNR